MENSNKWINVSEELPSSQTRVIAYCKTPNDGMMVAECWFTGNSFLYDFALYGQISVYASHWMPLPNPPADAVLPIGSKNWDAYALESVKPDVMPG